MGFLQAGIVASMVYNMFRGKDDKPLTPLDFIPGEKNKTKQQTQAEQANMLKNFFGKAARTGRKR